MEVHAHAHTPRKKWTHYFWEFLMLFLAVFCGFLAEYQLEHKIERDRSKQYIRSFYDDLNVNLSSISRTFSENEKKIITLNTLFFCYDTVSENITNCRCLAHILKQSTFFLPPAFADGTLGQLKNAGGFRLLNKEDRDSIISYDNYIHNYKDWEPSVLQLSQNNLRSALDELGYFAATPFLYTDSINTNTVPLLLFTDKGSVNKIFNVIGRYSRAISRQNKWMIDIKEKTNGLIKYFESKYHFQ